MLDSSHIVGKELNQVQVELRESGIPFRVSSNNGQVMMLTADYVPGRANLSIENGKVTGVSWG